MSLTIWPDTASKVTAPPGALVERWDDWTDGQPGNTDLYDERTATGTNGGWDWQNQSGVPNNFYVINGSWMTRSNVGGGADRIYYTDVGAGNINQQIGLKTAGQGEWGQGFGIMYRGTAVDDWLNYRLQGAIYAGGRYQGGGYSIATMDPVTVTGVESLWIRITESAGVHILSFWRNPTGSNPTPDFTQDVTSDVQEGGKATGTLMGVGRWQTFTLRGIGSVFRAYASADPADLPDPFTFP